MARNLSAIEDMTAQLLTQAVHKANDREMPGGLAMVSLAAVASPEAWEHIFEAEEGRGVDVTHVEDEDDTWEPPLQTLLFWSEQWRTEHGYELDRRPTIASEAGFIRWALSWAWENEPHWNDFTKDVRAVQRRLENLLYAGVRVERGVPCLYDECKGKRIVRHIADDGTRGKWHCPRCEREWNEDAYARMVTAAHEAAKFEQIGDEVWCTVDHAARTVGRSVKTIRTWVNDEKVSEACVIAGRRTKFVNLGEVREQDARANRRVRGAA